MRDSWTIGELAAESGLTVRALRHFEELGLLGAIDRTAGNRRTYHRTDVEQVYRVVALRSLGLPLAQIAAVLTSPPALDQALTDQLAHVDAQLAALSALRAQLQPLVKRRGREPISIEELMQMIHRTVVAQEILHEYLDETDRSRLAARATNLGDEAQRMIEVDYPRLYRAAQAQLASGAAPDAATMQAIAGELEALARRWSEDGASTSDKVQQMWADRSADITGRDYTELAEYVRAARAHYRTHGSTSS
ncbi:MAG TPA: MerR family transcriptional regulator [Jatrophihabitans sp.]|nr:MerR family transcriptional regulator [Jatrophihabitans sp.]